MIKCAECSGEAQYKIILNIDSDSEEIEICHACCTKSLTEEDIAEINKLKEKSNELD